MNMKTRYSIAFLFSLFIVLQPGAAQDLEAYVNMQRQFVVQQGYDKMYAEPVAPQSYKLGRELVAYNSNAQDFKVVYKGEKMSPTPQLVSNYNPTDHLLTFDGGGIVRVFDAGKTTLLSTRFTFYLTADSMVVYDDDVAQKLYVYYKGEEIELEEFIGSQRARDVRLGDNILAYTDYMDRLVCFYQGQKEILEYNGATNVQAARDIITYTDINGAYKANYKGESYTLDDFTPQQQWVGDRFTAFVSNDGRFKIFYDGSIKDIGYFTPERAGSQDFLFWYQDFNGYFKAFYEGNFYQLDTQYPDELEAKYRSLIFKDRFQNLIFFRQGKQKKLTSMRSADMRLDYDVVALSFGLGTYQVYGAESYND